VRKKRDEIGKSGKTVELEIGKGTVTLLATVTGGKPERGEVGAAVAVATKEAVNVVFPTGGLVAVPMAMDGNAEVYVALGLAKSTSDNGRQVPAALRAHQESGDQ